MKTFTNPYGWPRGTVCVIRSEAGTPVALAIEPSANWREWNGCFSLI
jgi:hypothetical protein